MTVDDVDFEIVMDVEESWLKIKGIPNYTEVAGEILFRKIFELAPGALQMFSFSTGFVGDEENLYQSDVFKAHAGGVVMMLDQAVNMLGPDMGPVLFTLSQLGERHVEYGVLPAHYGIVGQALLHTLATALGERGWTPRVKQGWELVYGLVSTAMMAGATKRLAAKQRRLQRRAGAAANHHARKEKHIEGTAANDASKGDKGVVVKPEEKAYSTVTRKRNTAAPTSETRVPTALRLSQITGIRGLAKSCPDTSKQEKVQHMLDDAISVISLSDASTTSRSTCDSLDPAAGGEPIEETVTCVFQSWEKIRRIPKYEEVAGVLLFRKIFEIAPGAKELFAFTKKNPEDDDDEQLYKNPRFLVHARRVVKMLDVAVDMLGPDLGPVSHALKLLGERHVAYGVIPDHYPIVGQALLSTLEAALGSSWTPQVQEGWAAIYGFVSATMVSGAMSKM